MVVGVDGGAVATMALRSKAGMHGVGLVKVFLETLGYDGGDAVSTVCQIEDPMILHAREFRRGGADASDHPWAISSNAAWIPGADGDMATNRNKYLSMVGSTLRLERGALSAPGRSASGSLCEDLRDVVLREFIKFGEIAMGMTTQDREKRSKKLDSVCWSGCWVGRREASDEHVLVKEEGVAWTKCGRRVPPPDVEY